MASATQTRPAYGGNEDVMVMAAGFCMDYYEKFQSSFSVLQTMYGQRAKILLTGPAAPRPATFDGQKEIAAHFESLEQFYGPRKVAIKSVDAVASTFSSLVVTVNGSILTEKFDADFTSVFILMSNNQVNLASSETFHINSESLQINSIFQNAPAKPAPVAAAAATQAPIGVPAPRSAAAPAPKAQQPPQVFEENDEERSSTPPPAKEKKEKRERRERKPRGEKSEAAPAAEGEEKKAEEPKKDAKPAAEKKAAAPRTEPKPNKSVVLRNVPKKSTIDDCRFYTEPFGKVASVEWLGANQRHAIVEFKYIADAKALIEYPAGFTMFKTPVRCEYFVPKTATPKPAAAAPAKEGEEKPAAPKAEKKAEGEDATAPKKRERRERKPRGEKSEAAPAAEGEKKAEEPKKEAKPAAEKKEKKADEKKPADAKAAAAPAKEEKKSEKKAEKKPAAAAPAKDDKKKPAGKKTEEAAAPKVEEKPAPEAPKKWTGWNNTPAGVPKKTA